VKRNRNALAPSTRFLDEYLRDTARYLAFLLDRATG
jgi:hypothetical protein